MQTYAKVCKSKQKYTKVLRVLSVTVKSLLLELLIAAKNLLVALLSQANKSEFCTAEKS